VNTGTAPENPNAGVKVATPVELLIVTVPSAAGGVVTNDQVNGPVPTGAPGVAVTAEGPVPDPLMLAIAGRTVSVMLAVDDWPH
jgi:hypothetical protein